MATIDNFVDPIDSMTVQRHIERSTRFNAEEIIRRFPLEWKEYKEKDLGLTDIEHGETVDIYEYDVTDFLLKLGADFGWEDIFGNEWREELTEVEIF